MSGRPGKKGQQEGARQGAMPAPVLGPEKPKGGGQAQSQALGGVSGLEPAGAPPPVFETSFAPCGPSAVDAHVESLNAQMSETEGQIEALEREQSLDEQLKASLLVSGEVQLTEEQQERLESLGIEAEGAGEAKREALRQLSQDIEEMYGPISRALAHLDELKQSHVTTVESQQKLADSRAAAESVQTSLSAPQQVRDQIEQTLEGMGTPPAEAYTPYKIPTPSTGQEDGSEIEAVVQERRGVISGEMKRVEQERQELGKLEESFNQQAKLVEERQRLEGEQVKLLEALQAEVPCDLELEAARSQHQQTGKTLEALQAKVGQVGKALTELDTAQEALEARYEELATVVPDYLHKVKVLKGVLDSIERGPQTPPSLSDNLIDGFANAAGGMGSQLVETATGMATMTMGVASFVGNASTFQWGEAGRQLDTASQMAGAVWDDPRLLVKPILDDIAAGNYASAAGRVGTEIFLGAAIGGIIKGGKAAQAAGKAAKEGAEGAADASKALGTVDDVAGDGAKIVDEATGGKKAKDDFETEAHSTTTSDTPDVDAAIDAGLLDPDSPKTELVRLIERRKDVAPNSLEEAVELIDDALEEHGMGWELNMGGDNAHRLPNGMRYDQFDGGWTVVNDSGEITIFDRSGDIILEM